MAETNPSSPLLRKALQVSFVVGLMLNLVNHGAALAEGRHIPWMGVMFNFLIPFCVSYYSGTCVAQRQKGSSDNP